MTLLDLYRKVKGICACLDSAGVPLKCNGNDFNIDFEIKSKDAIVSHIEVKQDLALTWEDMVLLRTLFDATDAHQAIGALTVQPMTREYYEYLLQEFNKQRKK